MRAGLMAAALALGVAIQANAAAPALQGQLLLRPLTPQELKTYALGSIQTASGLNTVAIGQPAYLDALVNISLSTADITNIEWVVTAQPVGSTVVLESSPLGSNVPTYEPAERSRAKVASRMMLRPDLVGQYAVRVTIATAGSGTTNITQKITAATYLGGSTCTLCHGGNNFLQLEDIATPWSHTLHARAFSDAIDGKSTDHFSQNCIKCHVVGFDANTNSVNGGFDDVATRTGWVFPSVLTNGNFAAMPHDLKNVANIQCENCHGPGSEHAFAFGNTNVANWPRLAVTYASGNCAQCHDSLSHHPKTAEWNNSRHAVATRSPSGAGRGACVRCHTASGFAEFTATGTEVIANTTYEAITCAACHDPHDAANPHQLRAANEYTLPEGTTVTNVGFGALCMTCHHSRNGSAVENVAKFQLNQPSWAGGVGFGPHDSTAGDMIEGVNGITYGKYIPSGSHSYVIKDVCVGCHIQEVPASDPAFTKVGGHTFAMSYLDGTNRVDRTEICQSCHGPIEHFNMVRKDYNEDGVIEGIQTEVQSLLDRLSTLVPNSQYRADGNYQADGQVKSIGRTSVKTNWPAKFLNAAWNHMFVNVEGSHGIHNAPYAIGLLKASIADLTDDLDSDGLSDKWEIAAFGSITLHNSIGDADNDGVSNALELAAGTNALLADSDGDGVNDLAELQAGSDPLNPNDLPGFVIKIYSAAEVEFASEIGKKYQIQRVSDVTGTWLNEGSVTNGTGNNISMLVSTRTGGSQGYFRVLLVP